MGFENRAFSINHWISVELLVLPKYPMLQRVARYPENVHFVLGRSYRTVSLAPHFFLLEYSTISLTFRTVYRERSNGFENEL